MTTSTPAARRSATAAAAVGRTESANPRKPRSTMSAIRSSIADERIADMVLLGFLGLADSVRPTAAAAVADLRAAGVEVVMITGDHPGTAAAIATELDILNGNRVLTGPELDALCEAALDNVLPVSYTH